MNWSFLSYIFADMVLKIPHSTTKPIFKQIKICNIDFFSYTVCTLYDNLKTTLVISHCKKKCMWKLPRTVPCCTILIWLTKSEFSSKYLNKYTYLIYFNFEMSIYLCIKKNNRNSVTIRLWIKYLQNKKPYTTTVTHYE